MTKSKPAAWMSGTWKREEWLRNLAWMMEPRFEQLTGKKLPKLRIAIGFPSGGARGRAIGECWAPAASGDGHAEIFIRPDTQDAVRVAATLAHELTHAVVGLDAKHGPRFSKVARELGLEGKACATVPGERFSAWIAPLLKTVGPLPHAALSGKSTAAPKQTTRLLKGECPECGCTIRITRTWLQTAGAPLCAGEGCRRAVFVVEGFEGADDE